MLSKARRISEKFHMVIHVALSVIVIYLYGLSGINFGFQEIIILIIMSVLPDMEHLVFFSTYGRKNPYTIQALEIFKREGFLSVCRFLAGNHKTLTSLYFHNIVTPLFFTFVSVYSFYLGAFLLSAAGAVLASHYLFDVCEDILMSGKLNPNWFFKFNKPSNYKGRK